MGLSLMASAVPWSNVVEGQLRLARRHLDAGEEVLPTLVVVQQQDAVNYVIPFQPDEQLRSRWFYDLGAVAFHQHPRAALVVQDTVSAALGLFGQARALVVSYQDADGLRRAQAIPYSVGATFVVDHEGATGILGHLSGTGLPEWGSVESLPEGDPRWEAAALSSFWQGVAYSRRSYDENRQSGRRVPAWRFRR